MTKKPLPTPELLCKLLHYEPDTGLLFWRERAPDMFKEDKRGRGGCAHKTWNTRFSGKEAFIYTDKDGYKNGGIFGVLYRAHRVIWAMETGAWPVDQIDHEDHDRSNNRFKNLREATHMENGWNQSIHVSNTSGTAGVHLNKALQKWRARITIHGKRISLGYFLDIEDAANARKEAEIKYGFHENHGK